MCRHAAFVYQPPVPMFFLHPEHGPQGPTKRLAKLKLYASLGGSFALLVLFFSKDLISTICFHTNFQVNSNKVSDNYNPYRNI